MFIFCNYIILPHHINVIIKKKLIENLDIKLEQVNRGDRFK